MYKPKKPRREMSKGDLVFLIILLTALLAATFIFSDQVTEFKRGLVSDYWKLSLTLSDIEGKVEIRKGKGTYSDAEWASTLKSPAWVRTGEDGAARLDISTTKDTVWMAPSTVFILESAESSDKGFYARGRLESGKIWVALTGERLELDTATATVELEGPAMSVEVQPETGVVIVSCLNGGCTLRNQVGSLNLDSSQTGTVSAEDLPPQIGEMSEEEIQEMLGIDQAMQEEPITPVPTVETEEMATPTPTLASVGLPVFEVVLGPANSFEIEFSTQCSQFYQGKVDKPEEVQSAWVEFSFGDNSFDNPERKFPLRIVNEDTWSRSGLSIAAPLDSTVYWRLGGMTVNGAEFYSSSFMYYARFNCPESQ